MNAPVYLSVLVAALIAFDFGNITSVGQTIAVNFAESHHSNLLYIL
jgi:hypothetical protein